MGAPGGWTRLARGASPRLWMNDAPAGISRRGRLQRTPKFVTAVGRYVAGTRSATSRTVRTWHSPSRTRTPVRAHSR